MTAEPRKRADVAAPATEPPVVLPFTPVVELEHLLKVAASVCKDADQVWAEMWSELKRIAGSGGMVLPEAEHGFVPKCGWPEFLEKFWLLKHYLDSVQRICERKH